MDNWYYKLFGDEFGPVTFDALVELAKSETLTSDDEVRFGESGPWRRAGSMGQLMAHMPAGAHLSSSPAVNVSVLPSAPEKVTASSSLAPKSGEPTGWYYQLFGDLFGPVVFDDLVELAKNRTLSVDDQVRFGENGAWRRAGSIGQLMAHLPFQEKKNAFTFEVESKPVESQSSDDFDLLPNFSQRVEPVPVAFESRTMETAHVSQPATTSAKGPTATGPAVSAQPTPGTESWWCMIEGKEYGPVDLPKIVAWAASGRLHRNDFVRRGLESYVVATDLPGLFPELPPAAVETKAEIPTKAPTRSMPTLSPAAAAPASAEPSSVPADAPPATPKPVTNWQAGAGAGAGFSRPAAPIRRPPAKSGSGSLDMNKMLVPILGVVGVVVLGGLIYLLLPFLGESADVKAFKGLQAAYRELQSIRNGENPPKKEDFTKAAEKMAKAAKAVEVTLTGKAPSTTKLKSLAKKLQELGKEDLSKIGDAEKAVVKSFDIQGKALKVK